MTGRITPRLMGQAFRSVRKNRGAAGVDKVSVQMFEKNLANSLGISMSQVQVTGMREGSVILDYNIVVEKNSKISVDDLKSLQNEKMKAGAIDVGGPVLSF